MQELLASYYGMHRGADRSSDIESTTFDAKAYVRGLLKNEKVETLLRKDDEMVRVRLSTAACVSVLGWEIGCETDDNCAFLNTRNLRSPPGEVRGLFSGFYLGMICNLLAAGHLSNGDERMSFVASTHGVE